MSLQVIYQPQETGTKDFIHYYDTESALFRESNVEIGFLDTPYTENATRLLYRGGILEEEDFPVDGRFVNNAKTYANYLYLPNWYPAIRDLTIPTIMVEDLNELAIERIKASGWERAFIKDWSKSVAYISIEASSWPDSDMSSIKALLRRYPRKGGFCIRKHLPAEQFENETRYFIMNGHIYQSSGMIPDIVKEAANRLSKLGGVFYVIDATPELIVEVNPGESSDRSAANSAKLFTSWIINEFN